MKHILVLVSLGCLTVGIWGTPHVRAQSDTIIEHLSIFQARGVYCAWPSVVRASNGDLLVAFTATEEHLAPDGRILMVRSTDNGHTWSAPDTLLDTPIDDRESGFTTLSDGTIVAHLWSTLHTRRYYEALPPLAYGPELLARWMEKVDALPYRHQAPQHGAWHRISTDNGHSWSPPARGKDAVHGGVQLKDGSLLIATYRGDSLLIGVHRAAGANEPYAKIATLRSPHPDSLAFGEPHIAQLPGGRIIMMIRATAKPYNDRDARCVLWESHSDDGGVTWVAPSPTPLWGFPPHLLVLGDGRVLCSYGYRRFPYGERACLSTDGITWNAGDEIILREDAPNGDLGYPASVELGGGKILTVYYQPDVPRGTIQEMRPPDPARTKPGILGTVWRVPALR